jgi:hypothetical protein
MIHPFKQLRVSSNPSRLGFGPWMVFGSGAVDASAHAIRATVRMAWRTRLAETRRLDCIGSSGLEELDF